MDLRTPLPRDQGMLFLLHPTSRRRLERQRRQSAPDRKQCGRLVVAWCAWFPNDGSGIGGRLVFGDVNLLTKKNRIDFLMLECL